MLKKILCVVGTRPEAIKMAPIIAALKTQPWCELRVAVTAQHRELLDQMLGTFNIIPDIDFDIMEHDQSSADLAAKILVQLNRVFKEEKPDAVMAQGDTTTVFVSALTAFYLQIPFYHVEAGLRSHDMLNPFPEEMNRTLTDRISTVHFAPTLGNKNLLIDEGVKPESIFVTGNTVIDALHYIIKLNIQSNLDIDPSKRLLLVTSHRHENFGPPLQEICMGLRKLVDAYDDIQILYPVHPNPHVQQIAHEFLDNYPGILLTTPFEYSQFISVLNQSYLVLTDSGGVQEEAPALGKPVLILRSTTERPEGVDEGVAKLVPLNADDIFKYTAELLDSRELYNSMVKKVLPYGDGTASLQIVEIIKEQLLNGQRP